MTDNVANKRMLLSLRRKVETISFLNQLMSGDMCRLDDAEVPPWFQPGLIHQILQTTYAYHAESKSVRWADGPKFMFANGLEPFQLFWINDGDYCGRQLSEEETFRFCQLTDVKRYT